MQNTAAQPLFLTELVEDEPAEKQGIIFEKQVEEQTASDSHITFDNYCDYAIGIKEQTGLSPSTVYTYNGYLQRVAPYIGHIQLNAIKQTQNKPIFCRYFNSDGGADNQ